MTVEGALIVIEFEELVEEVGFESEFVVPPPPQPTIVMIVRTPTQSKKQLQRDLRTCDPVSMRLSSNSSVSVLLTELTEMEEAGSQEARRNCH